jgi:hypothetical protein
VSTAAHRAVARPAWGQRRPATVLLPDCLPVAAGSRQAFFSTQGHDPGSCRAQATLQRSGQARPAGRASLVHAEVGSATRPMNKVAPVATWVTTRMNGRSAVTVMGLGFREMVEMTAAVAVVAWVADALTRQRARRVRSGLAGGRPGSPSGCRRRARDGRVGDDAGRVLASARTGERRYRRGASREEHGVGGAGATRVLLSIRWWCRPPRWWTVRFPRRVVTAPGNAITYTRASQRALG